MISKNKSQRGKIGTAYHIEKLHKSKKVNCKYYDVDDGSCYAKSIVLWEVGYDICNKCKQKASVYTKNKKENKSKTTKNKKVKKNNIDVVIKRIIKNSSRVKEVLKIASNYCELCNEENNNLTIYIVDKNKSQEDIDSILNIIAVCPKCKSKINKNKGKYINTIKKIVEDRLNKI